MTSLTFRFLQEEAPGTAWRDIVDHGWPGWREWYKARGGEDGPSERACRRAIRRHMPGFEGLLEELCEEAGDDDALLARFLTFWSPPRYLVNCTQVALSDGDGPLLIRNYDLDPCLNESTILRSRWQGCEVIGIVEAMAGLSDGMNENGLAASLTFGGRVARGDGFGIPMVIRYILQTCRDVQDGLSVLRSLPVHMSYNVTLTDPGGDVVTVMLSPDRPTIVSPNPWTTNHQLGVEWPHHGRLTQTAERAEALDHLLARKDPDADELKRLFHTEPIFSKRYSKGFGTVFTTLYRPADRRMEIGWSDGTFIGWDFDAPPPQPVEVTYSASGSAAKRGSQIAPTPTLAPNADEDWMKYARPWMKHAQPWLTQRLDAFRTRNRTATSGDWTNLNVDIDQTHTKGARE